jgi:predicted MPP superfamily phosphohydrolase
VREEVLLAARLPRGLQGFTIVHLSDLHAGPFLGRGDLRAIVEAVNSVRADLCVISGDFITHHWSESLAVLDECAALRASAGAFAVLGNHDYKDRLEGRIADAYAQRGIRFLRNERVRIERSGGSLCLLGIEDLEEARDLGLESVRGALGPSEVELILCHNPGAARVLAREGCVGILSGHTHGGQVDLPLLRSFGPAHPGLRVRIGPTTLIVNRGLGVLGVPLRIGAPAEVVVVRLASSSLHADVAENRRV